VLAEVGAGILANRDQGHGRTRDADAAHLRFLRDALGERFVAGRVLHTAPHAYVISERIYALPICSLWN